MKLTKCLAAALLLIPPAAFASPASGDKDKDEVNRIENAGTVMEEILNVPDDIPQDLLNKARCVVVLPSVLKAAFVVGGSYGRGVMVPHGRTLPRTVGRACDVRARRRQRWITDRRTSD
jgi:lipid-binding SYLF domain-containing protein